jgi:hypothetical protein
MRHWAYIRVGYKRIPGPTAKSPVKKQAVFKWVRVGSPFYSQLRSKGVKPIAVRTRRRAPVNIPGNTNSVREAPRPSGSGGVPKTDPKPALRKSGGSAPRRKRGNSGSNDQATIRAANQAIGKSRVGSKLRPGMADAIAGMQYDAPIHDLKVLIDRLGPQNAQALADISHWFGQAQAANAQAGSRDAAVAQDVAAQQDQAVKGLMASLGGGGNDANAAIAAQEANDSGLQRILGGIEQQYHSDMDPLLAQAAASAQTAQQNRNLQQMQDYQLQLADMLGQRGQAKASAQLDISKYNNELAQQWFQNALAKMQAGQAAASLGLDLQAKRVQIRQAKQQGGGSQKFVPWVKLNPAEKTQLLQAAVYTPDGRRRSRVQADQFLRGLGYSPHGNFSLAKALSSYY